MLSLKDAEAPKRSTAYNLELRLEATVKALEAFIEFNVSQNKDIE